MGKAKTRYSYLRMIQQKLKLSTELKLQLKDCEEIWIAVALISDSGFTYIQKHINETAKQNFLVGIGLPTSPNVLRQLKEVNGKGLIQSKIHYKPTEFFHPKVYIIKSNGKFYAYVGSGNCTDGGLDKNIELSIKTDDQEFCNHLLKWFNALYKHSKEITEEFLQSYQVIFDSRTKRLKEDKKETQLLFPNENLSNNLDEIDFSNQFFKKEHFQAFEGTKPWNETQAVNAERQVVRRQLFKLNEKILPKIKTKKWDISEHYDFDHIVSSAIHGQYTSNELGAIWLHYGRNKKEIKAYGADETPLDYMRLQVIINQDSVGIWNRVGKNNGSKIDRKNLKNKLNVQSFRLKLFEVIQDLPDNYYIQLNGKIKYVGDFTNEQQLTEYLLTDDYKHYFVIGIKFKPSDNKLSETNITETVIENFELLMPTYKLIKHELNL